MGYGCLPIQEQDQGECCSKGAPREEGIRKEDCEENPRVFSCNGVLIYRRASDPATLVSTGIHVLHSFGALVVLRLTNRNPNQHSCQRRQTNIAASDDAAINLSKYRY